MIKQVQSLSVSVFILLELCSALGAMNLPGGFIFTPQLDLRWRQEALDTLSAKAALNNNYSYGNLRERFGGDLQYHAFTFHMQVQAADSYNVPDNGSFGGGLNYFSNSNSNSAPSQIDVTELSVIAHPGKASFINVGRQGIKEGAEPSSGNTRLDWVEDNRVSERLIGTWDWTNVSRRFDGVSAGYNAGLWNVSAFGARILEGGFDYTDAFMPLDGVQTAGISAAVRQGVPVPHTEVRFFDIGYRDYRPITDQTLGDSLNLNTVGMDVVGTSPCGPGVFDGLIWGAYQSGNYGVKTQSAEAFLLEGGYGLPQTVWAPWFRAGVDYASGGSPTDSNTHTTFVNLAPTNHKFYGIQDLNAFQNLTDYFLQIMAQPAKSVKLDMVDHFLRLSNTRDGWYSGSGPSGNGAFGITDRLSAAGELSSNVGNEIDLVATWTPIQRLSLQTGYSHFEGGAAARTIYPVKSVTNFFYFQTTFKY